MFCNIKNAIKCESNSNTIYRITCPVCFNKYIGKIDFKVIDRLGEHGTKPDQPM